MYLGESYSSPADMQAHIIQDIFETARDAYIVVNKNGAIESYNKAASHIFGYKNGQLHNRNICEFIPQYDDLLSRLHESNNSLETIGVRSSGLDFPVEINIRPFNSEGLTSLAIRDVTEKKISSNCYLQKTSEFQSIFEVLPACFLRLDPNEIVLDYHIGKIAKFCSELLPLLGARLSELFAEPTATKFREAFQIVKETGEPQAFEYSIQQTDIKSIFTITIKPFLQEQMIAIIQEITDYKQAQKSLLNYHSLADILPIGIFRCEISGDYIYSNDYWHELTGDSDENTTNWLDSIHADDNPRIRAIWQQITKEGVPFNAEFRFLTPYNTTVYVHCRAVPEINENGSIQGYIGIAHNITENILTNNEFQKNQLELESLVEERTTDLRAKNRWLQQTITERKKIENTLLEERNFISTVLDTATAIIMVCDTQGRIVRTNRSLCELFGYSENELRGKRFFDYFIDRNDLQSSTEQFNKLKTSKQQLDYETTWSTKNGDKKLIAWSNTVILNELSEVDYVIYTGIDVTEQKKAEEEAKQPQADLIHVSRLSTMGEMATGLAHELNQPLAAIVNYTQGSVRLLDQTNDAVKPELIHALRQVTSQAERAGEIIRKLRELVNKGETHRSRNRIEKIVRNCLNFAETEIKRHATAINLRIDDNLPDVNVDAIQIEQVLINLIRNGLEAMTHSPNHQKRLSINVFLNKNSQIQVTITDHGEGLPTQLDENRVFDAFYTTKATGMGMGLAISRTIIEAHGGQMWVKRNVGPGTCFHFTIPI